MFSFSKKFTVILLIFLIISIPLWCIDKKTSQLIDKEIEKYKREIIKIRRFLHMNPELSHREFETSQLIASKLISLGFEVQREVAKTGVIGLLRGYGNGLTIGIRTPMDALPIQELTNVPYKSLNPGIMHASGNDLHISIALGAAMVLSSMPEKIKGNIKFIFQPAEETSPGEEEGAKLLIDAGVLEDPPVGAIFGFRTWPVQRGKVLFSSGPVLASVDQFRVVVKGKSSPTGHPHKGIDSVAIASQIIVILQNILNNTVDPTQPTVVSFGKIQGGIRPHLTPPQVCLEGTVRSFNEKSRERIPQLIENVVRGITQPVEANYSFFYEKGPPPVYNHPQLAQVVLPSLYEVIGKSNVQELSPQLFSDGFSYYCQKIPGFYFLLGAQPPEQKSMAPLYSPYFNPDEECIPIGIKIICHLLLNTLEKQSHIQQPNLP